MTATRKHNRQIGDRPRWKILFDEMITLEPGDMFSYDEMAKNLDLDYRNLKHRALICEALRKAVNELREEKKLFQLVRGEGYRCAEPEQALVLARRHQARAAHEIDTGRATIAAVDPSAVDVTTARLLQAAAIGLAQQAMMIRQTDIRQARLDTAMEAVRPPGPAAIVQVDASEPNLQDLQARIAELEANQRDTPRSADSLPTQRVGWREER